MYTYLNPSGYPENYLIDLFFLEIHMEALTLTKWERGVGLRLRITSKYQH